MPVQALLLCMAYLTNRLNFSAKDIDGHFLAVARWAEARFCRQAQRMLQRRCEAKCAENYLIGDKGL